MNRPSNRGAAEKQPVGSASMNEGHHVPPLNVRVGGSTDGFWRGGGLQRCGTGAGACELPSAGECKRILQQASVKHKLMESVLMFTASIRLSLVFRDGVQN